MSSENHAPRRVALVTGAGSGIGAEIGRTLARDGYAVAIADVDVEAAHTVRRELMGSPHVSVHTDVSEPGSVTRAFAEVEEALGAVDVVVHAAAVMLTQRDGSHLKFWESGIDRWDRTMTVNARGTYIVASEFARRRAVHTVPHGRLILFSSGTALSASSNRTFADYAASKAAVLGFMRHAARDCAALGITVNAVSPGLVETPMLRQNFTAGAPPIDPAAIVPLGRLGTPADLARLVRFIASSDSAYITGATFDINGGMLMR